MAVSTLTTETGETRVETGVGTVMKVDDNGNRNVRIEIRADHLNDHPVAGWVDSHKVPLPQVNDRVAYRIDIHRAKGVDPAIPLADLANKQKVRDVVLLGRPEDLATIAAVHRATGAKPSGYQDPPPPPTPRAARGGPFDDSEAAPAAPTAPPHDEAGSPDPGPSGPRSCPLCGHDLAGSPCKPYTDDAGERRIGHVACLDARAEGNPTPPPPPSTIPPRRPRVEEAKPWELRNSDGSANLGSYAFQAVLGFVELAHRLSAERTAATIAAGKPEEFTWPKVKGLARLLLAAADQAQANVRADGHSDRMDSSHTRARGAIREALGVYPVPWGASSDDVRRRWVEQLAEHATAMLRIALELHDA